MTSRHGKGIPMKAISLNYTGFNSQEVNDSWANHTTADADSPESGQERKTSLNRKRWMVQNNQR